MKNIQRKTLIIATIAYICIVYIIGLWPFDIQFRTYENEVHWIEKESCLEIDKGLAISEFKPERIAKSLINSNAFTLETVIRPASSKTSAGKTPARIISYSDGFLLRNFTLGQDSSSLVFRIRTSESDLNGLPPIIVENAIFPNKQYHIIIVYNNQHTKVYINGRLARVRKNNRTNLTSWNKNYDLILGNENIGNRPWQGKVYYLQIYNQSIRENDAYTMYANFQNTNVIYHKYKEYLLRYDFNKIQGRTILDKSNNIIPINLYIPKYYTIKSTLFPRISTNQMKQLFNLKDAFVNTFGFVFLAVLLFFSLNNKITSSKIVFLSVFIIGFMISLSIEVIQIFSMTRYSTVLDIIYNCSGMIIGIIIAQCFHMKRSIAQ